MKKVLLGLLLVVAVIAVSCSQDSAVQDDLISIRFTKLEAKAIDENVYSVTGDATWGNANVQVGAVGDYYWTYCAIKNDDGFTTGDTDYEYINWSEDKGLEGSKKFSAGEWVFQLKAYVTAEDRANRDTDDKAIFAGEVTTGNLTSSQSISVPMACTYVSGNGSFNFTISTTLTDSEDTGVQISKVEMVVAGETVELTKGATNWTGSKASVATGKQKVEIKVYLDEETTPRVSKEIGTAYVLHGLTTNVTGSATITISAKEIDISFDPELPSSLPADIAVGDILTLGNIPTSVETYGGDDITWKVLEVKEDRVLVLSEKILFNMKHYESNGMHSWANSLIKAYLNKEGSDGFLSQYGLSDVEIVAAAEDESGYGAGDVFLLSSYEVQIKYFNDSFTSATAYNLAGTASYWWTRSAGTQYEDYTSYDFVVSDDTGYFDSDGEYSTNEYGVRPAFWISIEE